LVDSCVSYLQVTAFSSAVAWLATSIIMKATGAQHTAPLCDDEHEQQQLQPWQALAMVPA
jgi:hypothetical protein